MLSLLHERAAMREMGTGLKPKWHSGFFLVTIPRVCSSHGISGVLGLLVMMRPDTLQSHMHSYWFCASCWGVTETWQKVTQSSDVALSVLRVCELTPRSMWSFYALFTRMRTPMCNMHT